MISSSVSNKSWIFKEFNDQDVLFYKENYSLDEITSKLLSIRKIKREDVKSFLNPSIKSFLPNPLILNDMEKSAKRTLDAIKSDVKIGIFGDYDVDGASATALLGNFLTHLKISYEIYIPDRKKEGFGPSIDAFKKLISNGVKLIFTVDCGTLSFEAIEYAYQNKIDVIVLDHHQSEVNLPKAYSIINPNRLDDNSRLNYLCAAGVTFMFLVAINKDLREIDEDLNEIEKKIIKILDQKIRPAVAKDGGDIKFKEFKDGIVKVQLQGSCSGCPSSTMTLKQGVQNLLCHYIPEVKEVISI